ncbi:hypothetical protein QJQ45_009854 [Haematococcus lacustris]|nr:hypothetical protein QJQ45_009854 [Haematococcus lacustris]
MVHGVFTLVDLVEQRHNQRALRVLQSIEQNLLPIESPMFSCHWPDPVSLAQWGQHFANLAAWLDQIGVIWIVMLLGITIVVVDLNKGFMQHYTPNSVLELLMGEDAAATAAELLPLITPRLSSSLRVREVAMVVEADRHFRYTSLTGHLTPRIEEHLARVYRPVPITNAGCETALKPLSSSRVDRMGAAQVAAHVKAHTEPLHTWYQYITEDSLAANRAAKRRCVADAKAPSCLLVATPISTAASPSLLAATNSADIPSPHPTPAPAPATISTPTSFAITAGAQAGNRRKLQEQHRRQKRAAAELSITMRAACKFWNTAKLSHSDLLMRVKADVELGRSCQTSWSAQFQLAARELMGGEFTLSPDMVLGTKAMEVKWLKRQLSTEVRTSLTRFSLGNSGLGVEKARFEAVTFIDRTCTRCTEWVVDNAMHFIFKCTATSSIREQPEFAMTLQNNNENLHDFMLSPCAPLFVHLALKCVTESPEPLEGEAGLAA